MLEEPFGNEYDLATFTQRLTKADAEVFTILYYRALANNGTLFNPDVFVDKSLAFRSILVHSK